MKTLTRGVPRVTRYPFELWPKMSRDEVNLLRQCVRSVPYFAISTEASGVPFFGTTVLANALTPERLSRSQAAKRLLDSVAAVLFENATTGTRVVLECELMLARTIVDLALGLEPVSRGVLSAPLHDIELGVLAYAMGQLAHTKETPLKIRGVISESAAILDMLTSELLVVWTQPIRIDAVQGVCRWWTDDAVTKYATPHIETRVHDSILKDIEMEVACEAVCGQLLPAELARIELGDVVVFDNASLTFANGLCHGQCNLRVVGSSYFSYTCEVENNAIRVLDCRSTKEPAVKEARHVETTATSNDSVPITANVPIDVSVEIARFSMTLDELARIKPGEVFSTNVPIGQHVSLRVKDHTLLSGELIDVDGEIGIRVLKIGA